MPFFGQPFLILGTSLIGWLSWAAKMIWRDFYKNTHQLQDPDPRKIIMTFFSSSAGVTFQFQCSTESTNGTGVQGGQIPELIFYGPSISGSNTNTLKRSRSPENCQGVVVTKET